MAKGGKREGAGRPRKADEEKVQRTIRAGMEACGLTEADWWAMVVQKSIEGSSTYARLVANYLYGKAPESVTIKDDSEIIIKLGSQN